MRLKVKDYCRIILYLPPDEKVKSTGGYRPQKPKRIEDDVEMHLSEDETPVEPEDASTNNSQHRPPSYNPEDYAHAIAKYARSPNLYVHDPKEKKSRGKDKDKNNAKDGGPEMSLKQFASLPELLRRLREDLKTAYLSFVKELVREPHDGIALLMDLLKMIQLAQNNLSGNPTNREQQIALRRALIDEFECLSCLRCCLRCSDSATRLANYRNGLYALAAATMSSLTRSRTLALQLLTKACDSSACGHRQVVEAFSTLRLRFAEPVRCKFLVSMMLSYPHPSFQVWGLKFVNTLLSSSTSLKERIYLQEELGEAGFEIAAVKKALEHRGIANQQQQEAVKGEIDKWTEGYIDLTALEDQLTSLKSATTSLQDELQHLRQANMKLLEENVLLKTVGGEVEERCSALKRRLENHGIPSAPSPTPSVTDSEVSSFVTTGRSTIKRNNSISPNRTMDRVCSPSRTIGSPDGERSTSLEWKMVRSSPDGQGPSRELSRQGSHEGGNTIPPTPLKRSIINNKAPELPKRSVYINDFCTEDFEEKLNPRMSRVSQGCQQKSNLTNGTKFNGVVNGHSNKQQTEVVNTSPHLFLHPPKPIPPKKKKLTSNSSKSSTGSENELGTKSSPSNSSLSSSTSSLSATSSTASLEPTERKEPDYENLPKKEKTKCTDEKEVDYERDVIVYEAITLGSDTIVLDKDKTNTQDSKGSNNNSCSSSDSKKSKKPFNEGPNVRLSVRHYENLVSKPEKVEEKETKKGMMNGFLNGLKNGKKKSGKGDKKESKNEKKQQKEKEKNSDVSDKDVEAVMNGLENIIKNAESSISLGSAGTVKENPLLKENFEDRASPEQSPGPLEIVSSRGPPIPSKSRSRTTMSSHSGSRGTPDPVIYLESPSETSDTDTFQTREQTPPSPVTMDTASTKSFGWIRGDVPLKRRDTFIDRVDDSKPFNRRHALRRSESMHASNISEYNSHRSYSPKRRSSTELVAMEESEVQINGRKYTQYTPQQHVERKNNINKYISSEMKRRRNRSYDDRLDQWLDEDYMRQRRYESSAQDDFDIQSKRRDERRTKPVDNRNGTPQKMSRNGKTRYTPTDAYNGFKNPKTGLRESDYGPNFMLNSPTHHRLEEVLSDLADFGSPNHGKLRGGRLNRKKMIDDDPAIPTPDYSATPAGTLTNDATTRHILDLASGLY